ncbi:uncharacterized protein [Dendrobates tinctorius]|uniref:uncharacterized protein n=1 Tax=Dendrobates tinctorius TaxID=92724 RepID=UPI003CC94941
MQACQVAYSHGLQQQQQQSQKQSQSYNQQAGGYYQQPNYYPAPTAPNYPPPPPPPVHRATTLPIYLLLLQISYVFFNFFKTSSSSSSADGTSEGKEQEQRSQVPVVIRNVPQRDEDVYLDNEQLISLVQERAPLWDSRDRLYKDNVVTRRLWNEVAAALMDGWDSATASSKKAFSEYFPALYCAAVTVVLDGTVGFRARYILAGNLTVSSGSTVTALSIVLLYCAAVTVVLDGTVGFRARYILAGNPTVSSGSTVTALSIVLLYCAAVTVVLDGTVFFFPTVDKVRTRWRSIKDRFNSDVRAEGQVRSGSASRTRTRYRHYHALQFLRPVLATRSTWSSTLQPGPGAVLPRTSSDPSQPSDSYEAP